MLKLCLSISSTCKKWIPIFFFFFNAIDLDEEELLKNVFRVGEKSREEYKIFGDVVSFDTTYITNKYKCHLLHLLEWTNHLQSVLLGCALLGDETASTFTWLMETWVRAMGGKASTALLTDQDRAIYESSHWSSFSKHSVIAFVCGMYFGRSQKSLVM